MQTVTTNVYSFNELSKESQKIAIEKERQYNYEHGEPLFFFDEYCNERAKGLDFYDCKFQWSISYCQGDGLSFSGRIDANDLILKCFPNIKKSVLNVLCNNITIEIKGNTGHYTYAAKSDVDLWMDNYSRNEYNNIQIIVDELKEYLEDIYIDLCNELEKEAYSWIESENEDASIIERIEANNYKFTEDGKIF